MFGHVNLVVAMTAAALKQSRVGSPVDLCVLLAQGVHALQSSVTVLGAGLFPAGHFDQAWLLFCAGL